MADMKTQKIKGVTAGALEGILKALTEMLSTKGHGLAFQLNKNLFSGRKVLKEFYERLEEAKAPFFEVDEEGNKKQFVRGVNGLVGPEVKEGTTLQPGQEIVFKFKEDQKDEALEMLNTFEEEVLNVQFVPFDEKRLNKALEKSIFDGIDLTPLFDTLIN